MNRSSIAKRFDRWGPWVPKPLVAPSGRHAPREVHTVLLNEKAGYVVLISTICWEDIGDVDHLWITRRDGNPIRSWSDVQRIKRECLEDGGRRLGVEIYPAEEDVVDEANMYHLWVLPLGFRRTRAAFPFGLEPGAAR